MTKPDERRLGIFFGILILFVTLFLTVSLIADVSMITLAPVYMFTPLIAGIIVCLVYSVPLSTVGLTMGRPRWLATAALLPISLIGLTLLLSIAVPNIGFNPMADPVPGIGFPSGISGIVAVFVLVLVTGATVNAIFAFGEEFGWRGYLLWELAPLGFWKASGVIGTVWGIWHAPVIIEGYNFPSFPLIGVAMMTVACLAFSPVYTYLVIRAESLLAAALLHGVFNGSAGLVLAYTATNSTALAELVASPVGIAGIISFSLVTAGIAVRGAPHLDQMSSRTDSGVEDTA